MYPDNFFRLALLLPIATPVVADFCFDGDLHENFPIEYAVFNFSVAQYAIFSIFCLAMLRRKVGKSGLITLALKAPLAFVPFQWVGWQVYFSNKFGIQAAVDKAFGSFLLFGMWTVVIGYLYVMVTLVLFIFIEEIGLIKDGSERKRKRKFR